MADLELPRLRATYRRYRRVKCDVRQALGRWVKPLRITKGCLAARCHQALSSWPFHSKRAQTAPNAFLLLSPSVFRKRLLHNPQHARAHLGERKQKKGYMRIILLRAVVVVVVVLPRTSFATRTPKATLIFQTGRGG